jgi:hypothetical protein
VSELLSNKKFMSFIDMTKYGIKMLVSAEHECINSLELICSTLPDSVWVKGKGKKYVYQKIKKNLIREELFFKENKSFIGAGSQRWIEFCEKSSILAALHSAMYHDPIQLIEVETYD